MDLEEARQMASVVKGVGERMEGRVTSSGLRINHGATVARVTGVVCRELSLQRVSGRILEGKRHLRMRRKEMHSITNLQRVFRGWRA